MTASEPLDAADALERIIRPQSVVVIGANETPGRLTSGSIRNLLRHGYPGRIYAVNPNRREVFGVPCHARIADLPEVPDTAVIVVAAGLVPAVVEECATLGIRAVTVIASGFDEGAAGASGSSATQRLRAVLQATGVRMIGPNTAGLLNLADGYVPRASLNHPADLVAGRVGIVTQSGGLSNVIVNRASANGVGVGICVATGNQLDLNLWDVGDYVLNRPNIDILLMIIEGFKDPARFVEVAQLARRVDKPLALLKLGTSEAGQRVVETHSGALAGSAPVQAAVMEELGVIQARDLDELWELASLVTRWGPPSGRVRRIGVVTPSGGDGAIAADEGSAAGLDLPAPTAFTRARVNEIAADVVMENPFDTQAALTMSSPDSLPAQVEAVAGDPGVDAVLLALPVLGSPEMVRALDPLLAGIRASGRSRVAISAWSAGAATVECLTELRATDLPVFDGSGRAMRAIRLYDCYADATNRPYPQGLAASARAAVRRNRPATLDRPPYWEARAALADIGVPFNSATRIASPDEAVAAAEAIGYPVTVKVSSRAVNHKAGAGGVFVYLESAGAVRGAVDKLLSVGLDPAAGDGIVVEEYVPGILTAFVGGHRDPEFGPIVLAGLGGALAEPYRDIAYMTAPAEPDAVLAALDGTVFGRDVLPRWPAARAALVDVMTRLSQRFAADDELESFDLNPVLIRPDESLVAVDARLERIPRRNA